MDTCANTVQDTCDKCSAGRNFQAAAFSIQNTESVVCYVQKLRDLWTEFSLPYEMNETYAWSVYKLSSKKKFSHRSLFFVCDEPRHSHGFTMELDIRERKVVPLTRCKSTDHTSRRGCYKLGVVTTTADNIVDIGLNVLSNFGPYHGVNNNCQDFCGKLASELDIQQPWTDLTIVKIVAGVAVGVAVIGAIVIVSAVFCRRPIAPGPMLILAKSVATKFIHVYM